MKNNERTPQLGMIVALCVVLTGIWLMALYGAFKEEKTEKYDVRVSPGAVTYGTHSSAVIPMVSSPMHSTSAPMISGGAVRSYAYQGHATTSSATGPGFKMHTTSSATVHTIGSGGGGDASSPLLGGGGASSASRGITYGGASVSMPTFALVTPTYASQASKNSRKAIGPRKAAPTDPGEEGDAVWDDDESKWWVWDPNQGDYGNWVAAYNGATRYNDLEGRMEYWDESQSKWVTFEEWSNMGVPVGATPWFLMLFLAIGYGIVKVIRKKQNAI